MMKIKLLVYLSLFLWRLGLLDQGVSGVDTEEVSVMEGDSVTLNTGVQTKHQDKIRWYFNNDLIAQINGEQSKICTDVQCNEGTERFRGRLKLDHQTGSLTITNTKNADAGAYHLKISSGRNESEKIFSVTIRGVSAAERDEMKRKSVKEGESVTLDSGVIKNPNDVMTWYFKDTLMAENTGDQSKICTDVQCDEGTERFRDRLKLDHQTGSLTITNTRNTDSGEYQLQISSSRFSILKTFSVSITAVPGSGLSPGAVAGIVVAVVVVVVVVLMAAAGVIYYCHRRSVKRKERQKGNGTAGDDQAGVRSPLNSPQDTLV